MPDIEICGLEQQAVLYRFLRSDGRGGPVVDDAESIQCRWKWVDNEAMRAQDATISVDAKVVVAIDVPVDSLLWLGRLQDLSGTAGPLDESTSGLCQVKSVYWTPDVKGRAVRRTLGVVRWRGKLPQGVG